jgi:hypothetical protein
MMSGGELLLGYVGDGRTLDYYAEQLKQAGTPQIVRRTIEEDIADRARRWNAEGELVFRASVPPARIQEFARLAGLQAGDRWVADAAFGVVIGSAPPATSARLREAASRLDGTVRFRRGSIIGPLLDVSTNPVERQIIERLKKAYDPDNQLNPLPWH